MKKENWRKVFRTISDETLVELVRAWSLSVNGFRNVTKDNIKVARKLILTESLKAKNIKIIKLFYSIWAETEGEEEKGVWDYSMDELLKEYADGEELHYILGGLYSSEKEEHEEMADKFIEELFNKYEADSLEGLILEKEDEESAQDEKQVENEGATSELEKKYEKLEIKNQKLQKQVTDWEQQYSTLKKEYKAEKQSWIKEKNRIQQDLGCEKSALEKKLEQYETLLDENAKLKSEMDALKAEVAHLHASMLNSQKEVAATVTREEKIEELIQNANKILVIGDPKNKLIENSENPLFLILDPKEALEEIECQECNEIWIMEYLVSPTIKRKISKKYKDKVRTFKDFTTVKTYLEKGRR